ncbi:MAG: TonB-dependent receptor [Chitinophagaceae bacterium]|nr:TonB-dependent receptor [Chitinophagaceae bacterium]
MSRFLFILLLTACQLTAHGQLTISGKVMDKKSVLAGVSIVLVDTYDGATSDSSGHFSFTTTEKGDIKISATAIGYKPFVQDIPLGTENIQLDILLKEEITELKAVVISAGSFEASDSKRGTVLNSIDIATTASANADVTAALKTLPGAQQVGESEGLFVRGGTAGETKTFIDGTLVNNFFFSSVPNVSQRGRFSPFIFKGTVFSAGGYSALYGQALSSAVILESIDLPEQSSGALGISVIGASAGFQHLAKDKKSSWGINYGYTNLWLAFKAIKQKQTFFKDPEYHSADANFRIKTSATGIIKYYGYLSANKLGFRTPSIDTPGYKDVFTLSNLNIYHNLSYKEIIGGWKMNAGFSFTNNRDKIEGALENENEQKVSLANLETKNFQLDSKGLYANAKLVLEKKLAGLSAFRFGTEYNFSSENPDYTLFTGEKIAGEIKQNLVAAFAETDIYLTNNLAAKLGVRSEHSSLISKLNWAPRISLAYKLGEQSQASLAYGIFYQSPESRYLPAISDLEFTKATHYIAQYQKMGNSRTFRTEIFYKKYDHLLKTTVKDNREIVSSNNGNGDAKGIEVFWRDRKSIKGVDYWFSYSYLDTKRDFLNYPYALQPSFAANHTASLVIKKFVSKFKSMFNASYTYSTGRPYYNIRYDDAADKFAIYDQGKTIDYNSLSLSINYLPNIFEKGAARNTVFVFSITNVFGSNQVFGYQYSFDGHRKEAIVPPSKRFIFLGAFISLGVDRTQDIINSNL